MIKDNIHRRLYRDNKEANEIWDATQPELDAIGEEIRRTIRNTRASLADLEGIEIWETKLSIIPDLARDTPDERRDRVLEVLRTSPPFTELWLAWQIYLRFPNGGVSVDIAQLIMHISMDVEDPSIEGATRTRRHAREFVSWLRSWIPANVLLMIYPSIRYDFPLETLYTGGQLYPMDKRIFKDGGL